MQGSPWNSQQIADTIAHMTGLRTTENVNSLTGQGMRTDIVQHLVRSHFQNIDHDSSKFGGARRDAESIWYASQSRKHALREQ